MIRSRDGLLADRGPGRDVAGPVSGEGGERVPPPPNAGRKGRRVAALTAGGRALAKA